MVFYPYFGSSHICPQLERFSTYSNQFGSHISLDNWPRLSYQYSQNGNYTLCWHRCSFFHLYIWQTNESQLRLNCSTRVKIRWKRQPLRDNIFNVKTRLTVSVFLKCTIWVGRLDHCSITNERRITYDSTLGINWPVLSGGNWPQNHNPQSIVASLLHCGFISSYLNWPVLQPGGVVPVGVGTVGEIVAVLSGRQLGVKDTSSMAISPW